MLTKRIIPCLDVSDGRVVKGVRFQGLRDAGDPVELVQAYEQQGADELVLLDVSATPNGRKHQLETVRNVREHISIPLTVGGGVALVEDAGHLLEAGADKVSVNTAVVKRPNLVNEIAKKFGSQCMILAMDVKRLPSGKWQVLIRSGKEETPLDAVTWAKEAQERGAGEILLTSWDRDGTREGYDLDLLSAVAKAVHIPIIASGGANSAEHMMEAIGAGASAVLAASIFHESNFTVGQIKQVLLQNGVSVRL